MWGRPNQIGNILFPVAERTITSFFTVLSILLFPVLPFAQASIGDFVNVPIEIDGIHSVGVNAIAQDHRGYLWISTLEGLARYDGYEFKVYKNIPGDATSILTDNRDCLYVDYTGDLWVGTGIGLSRYNPDGDCFFNYPLDAGDYAPLDGGLVSNSIVAITGDRDHNVWVAVQGGGLLRYDREHDRFIRLLDDPDDPNALWGDVVRKLLVDRQNNIWIGTGYGHPKNGNGLVRFDPVTGRATRFKHDPDNPNSLLDNRISALLEDRQGRIWVGTYQSGLHYFDPQREEFIRLLPDAEHPSRIHAPIMEGRVWQNDPFVSILHEDRKGGFWVGTIGKGLNHFDGETGALTFYAPETGDDPFKSYWVLQEDRYGQIWLGTISGGLYRKDLYPRNFHWYPEVAGVQVVRESRSEPGLLWLGLRDKGLVKFNVNSGAIIRFQHQADDVSSIGDNIVRAIYLDREDNIWLGLGETSQIRDRLNGRGGLDRLDEKTGIFYHYPVKRDPADDFNETVLSICEDNRGYLWLGTGTGGLFRSDENKRVFRPYPLPAVGDARSPNAEVYYVQEAGGHLWASDNRAPGTLYRFDYDKDQFLPFFKEFKTTTITEDQQGGYWIGTREYQGLLWVDSTGTRYHHYTTKDGLPGSADTHVVPGDDSEYWIGTQNGLGMYDAATGQFHTAGLPSNYFNNCGIRMADGRFVFSGHAGLLVFRSEQVRGNPFPPDIVLKDLQISGEPMPLNSELNGFRLNYDQNDFSFEFTGIHLADPAKNRYKYRLDPYDADWIDGGTERKARYTNLDPGAYTFRLSTANRDGVWHPEGLTIPFHVRRAWWTTWWAYALYLLLVGGMVYSVYRFQLSKKLALAETRRLQEVNQLKTNLYTNITHEFRTPLTVILGMTDALDQNVEAQHFTGAKRSIEMIRRSGKNLLHLVNEMLDLAKLESGRLELQLIRADVIPFVKYLCESFHSLAAEKQIRVTVKAEVGQLEMDFDTQKLSVVLSNLLSNAVKFTEPGGQINVLLGRRQKQGQSYFFVAVKDTGIGISQTEIDHIFDRFYRAHSPSVQRVDGTGIGLTLTRDLVELMDGTIEVNSSPGKGTEFVVGLPVRTTASAARLPEVLPDWTPDTALTLGLSPIDGDGADRELPLALIVEDNTDVAHYLKICLQEKYRVLHAADGLAGIELALESTPDVIICDVMMPGKNGFEVCATLKADERTDHIPIIMLTAKVSRQDQLTGLSRGADAYLAKPFEKEELMIRLDKLIEIRKTLQKKYSSSLVSSTLLTNPPLDHTEKFIEKTERIIIEHLEEEDFSIQDLAQHLNLSRSQTYRKIKALTGLSTTLYIRFIRLQKAKELLAGTDLSVSEIAYRVGFKTPVYFSQVFKEAFDESPMAARRSLKGSL